MKCKYCSKKISLLEWIINKRTCDCCGFIEFMNKFNKISDKILKNGKKKKSKSPINLKCHKLNEKI